MNCNSSNINPTDELYRCKYCNVFIKMNRMFRHEKRCDKRKLIMEHQLLPYYSKDCNVFDHIYSHQSTSYLECIENVSLDFDYLNAKILTLYTQLVQPLIKKFELDARVDLFTETNRNRMKHKYQEISILKELMKRKLVLSEVNNRDECKMTIVELGAGQGRLSHSLGEFLPHANFICIERSSYKTKSERLLPNSRRAKVDLQHVDIAKLLDFFQLQNTESDQQQQQGEGHEKVVFVGKHVCGSALDFSLMAITHYAAIHPDRLHCIAIATCCHASCSWTNCAAREFLQSMPSVYASTPDSSFSSTSEDHHHNLITDAEWSQLRKMAGFFTPDMVYLKSLYQRRKTVYEESSVDESMVDMDEIIDSILQDGVCPQEAVEDTLDDCITGHLRRAALGLMCKRLIDWGRLRFVERYLGLQAELVLHVEATTSPENCLLIAYKKT